MSSRNPYDKGPLKRGELPRMALGTGVLVFGTWALTRYAIDHARRETFFAHVKDEGNDLGVAVARRGAERGGRFR